MSQIEIIDRGAMCEGFQFLVRDDKEGLEAGFNTREDAELFKAAKEQEGWVRGGQFSNSPSIVKVEFSSGDAFERRANLVHCDYDRGTVRIFATDSSEEMENYRRNRAGLAQIAADRELLLPDPRGLTLIEALRRSKETGERFRRGPDAIGGYGPVHVYHGADATSLHMEDILADDWEPVQDEPGLPHIELVDSDEFTDKIVESLVDDLCEKNGLTREQAFGECKCPSQSLLQGHEPGCPLAEKK